MIKQSVLLGISLGLVLGGTPGLGNSYTDLSDKAVLNGLKDKDPEARRLAAEELGKRDGNVAVKPLIKALKDKDLNVRKSAAVSLGELGSRRAVSPLIKTLNRDVPLRPFSIGALGKIKDQRAIPYLEKMIFEKDSQTVVAAVLALKEVSGNEAIPIFVKALRGADDYSCQALANALGKLRDPQTAPALGEILQKPENRPRCAPAAADALGWVGSQEGVGPLMAQLSQSPQKVQVNSIRSLGRLKAVEAAPLIETFLDHPVPQLGPTFPNAQKYL